MDEKFKVRIAKVDLPTDPVTGNPVPQNVSFGEAIRRASGTPLRERQQHINGKHRRLEACKSTENSWLLNFITLTYVGPGRARIDSPVGPMGLDEDEYFATETAALYDADENLLFFEFMRGGMAPGAIAKYLSKPFGEGSSYHLIPMLDREASARARQFHQIRKVTVRVATSKVSHRDRDGGLSAMKALGTDYGANFVDVVLGVDRVRSSSLFDRVWALIHTALVEPVDDVTKLEIYGRENDDDPLESIDLLQHIEKREELLQVADNSRIIPVEKRWDSLRRMRREFLNGIAIR